MNKHRPISKVTRYLVLSPLIIFAGTIVALVVAPNPVILLFLIFYGGSGLANVILKKLSQSLNTRLGPRPNACGVVEDGACTGCGISLCPNPINKVLPSWGMPSGHAQSAVFAATFATAVLLRPFRDYKAKTDWLPVQLLLIWGWTFAVCIQRVSSGCHSVLQVLVGGGIGCVLGLLGFAGTRALINKIKTEKNKTASVGK